MDNNDEKTRPPSAHKPCPFPLPLRVVEREVDGSVYIEGGHPNGRHLAFDVACTFAEACYIVEAIEALAESKRAKDAALVIGKLYEINHQAGHASWAGHATFKGVDVFPEYEKGTLCFLCEDGIQGAFPISAVVGPVAP